MSYELFNNSATPATPASAKTTIWSSTYKRMRQIDDTGLVMPLVSPNRFNVCDYGAKGDGATNDSAAIQAAIDAAKAAGVSGRGVDLFFPAGIYALATATPLTLVGNNVTLIGEGWQSTVLYYTAGTTGDVLQIGDGATSCAGLGLRDMSIWKSAAGTAGINLKINKCNDVTIRNFVINNGFDGIRVLGTSIKVWIENGEINNCGVTTGIGIQVTNGVAGDTYIGNIVMSNNPANKPAAGIQITETGHLRILGCNVTSFIQGLHVNPGASQDVNYLYIDETLFDSCGTHGAQFSPTNATGRIRSVVSMNSWYAGTTTTGAATFGLEIGPGTAGSTVDGLTFIGARVLNNQRHGVGITYASATNLSFTDCTVSGNGQEGSNTYDAVNVVANVNNLSFVDSKLCQSGTAANQQRHAFNIAAGTSAGIQVVNNQCAPNGTVGAGGSYLLIGALTGGNNLIQFNNPQVAGSTAYTMPATVATSGTGDTLIFSAKIPANSIKIGDTFSIETHGISSSTGTLIFRVHAGANGSVADTTAWVALTSAAQAANQRAGFRGLLTVRSLTTVQCEALGYAQAALLPTVISAVATTTITSTAAWFITISCTCSVGTWTAQEASITPL